MGQNETRAAGSRASSTGSECSSCVRKRTLEARSEQGGHLNGLEVASGRPGIPGLPCWVSEIEYPGNSWGLSIRLIYGIVLHPDVKLRRVTRPPTAELRAAHWSCPEHPHRQCTGEARNAAAACPLLTVS